MDLINSSVKLNLMSYCTIKVEEEVKFSKFEQILGFRRKSHQISFSFESLHLPWIFIQIRFRI
jgi:hypothetical protein